MGGGGASGSSGIPSNTSGQAVAYQPTAQSGADLGFQSLLGGLFTGLGPAYSSQVGNLFPGLAGQDFTNAFAGTPGGVSYGMAQNFLGGLNSGTLTDPNMNLNYAQALQGARDAAAGAPGIFTAAGLIPQMAGQAFGQASNAINAVDPAIIQALQGTAGANIANAQQQSQNLGALGSLLSGQNFSNTAALAPQNFAEGGAISNAVMQALGPTAAAALTGSQNLNQYGNQILNTAFDPQQALYNQLQNQVSQQAQAANAAAGLGGSAYGASTAGNTLSNFDINWQNQQLARQAQGLASAQPAYAAAAQLPFAPGQAAGQTLGTATGLAYDPLRLGGAIGQGIAGLEQTANQLPYSVMGNLANLGGAVAQQQYAPGSGFAQLTGQAPGLLSAGAQLAGLPYGAQATDVSNALQALGSQTNLGNQQFVIPQQIANDLQSYLGLGQAASGLSGQLGALGLNEQQQGMAGIGSALGMGSNLLFGNQGLTGALGLGNSGLLGGLFGGGGGAAASGLLTPGVGGAFATAPFTDLAATGAAAGGGGAGLASLLPFAAS